MSQLSSKELLAQTAHRQQWALPARQWAMAQTWEHLLFAHWPIPVDALRPLIPSSLPIDIFDGQAWLGIVPFDIRHLHLRGIPPLPLLSAFPELNVRTYVTMDNKPGVWFFSLDAANLPGVVSARLLFHLPYFMANMRVKVDNNTVTYHSALIGQPAEFRGSYRPISEIYASQPGTLEYWLTERYYLYAADRRGRLYRSAIHHLPWPLQRAEAHIEQETTALSYGLRLPDAPPLLHYAHHLDMLAWLIEPV